MMLSFGALLLVAGGMAAVAAGRRGPAPTSPFMRKLSWFGGAIVIFGFALLISPRVVEASWISVGSAIVGLLIAASMMVGELKARWGSKL